MEIHGKNFLETLKELEKHVDSAHYVSIDCEFSGLLRDFNLNNKNTLQDRYELLRKSSIRYTILQIGITFIYLQNNGKSSCIPVNINVSPLVKDELHLKRDFCSEASSIKFLIQQGFDFNKQLTEGVPYLSRIEERNLIDKVNERSTDDLTSSILDACDEEILVDARNQIKNWLSSELSHSTSKYLNITTSNRFIRKAIQSLVKIEFPTLKSYPKRTFLQVRKAIENSTTQCSATSKSELKEDIASDQLILNNLNLIKQNVGLRHLWDYILKKKKSVVCHNGMADLVYLFSLFEGKVPETILEFSELCLSSFKSIYDTKLLYLKSDDLQHVSDGIPTDLLSLVSKISLPPVPSNSSSQRSNVSLNSLIECPYKSMMSRKRPHEAGKDSYDTALLFVYYVMRTKHSDIQRWQNVLPIHGSFLDLNKYCS
ncbi:triman, ribonuclease involved in priRNA formation Tri1 [Schizosaccharomyces pombe]|uniref:Uncharacterized protein C29A10.09c n=1 Tax=Schizosaccharomyces pombe (strain 972 / ATCC 24843) TaxID=284812 RepID=YGS9_SCHPO|nr:putative CAF1 family ribonuclease [Schizosaccharomyces pombe]O94386.1 RecName: Full=Uncharacterized protein C29A10.09c [Schizosaccharomyces pombe 972h-]CAA22437.1 CAF1 family ribonuclease (predicted) [Schizosaccharomyces pombe]|eukprot:NP_596054.1 putative CAF1 family ribonuclease [Schizosaccharomyces pombe]